MKNIYFFSFLANALFLLSVPAKAQNCNPTLATSTLIVTNNTTITNATNGQSFLVCSGVTLTYQGPQSIQAYYYLETGAKVELRSYHYPYIYMRTAAELDAGYSLTPMYILEVNYESGAIFTDTSNQYINSLNLCVPLTFNYSQIPGGVAPCPTTTGFSGSISEENEFSIYPNPAEESFTLTSGQTDEITNIRFYNLTGEEVLLQGNSSQASSITFDRQHIPSGIYFMKISSQGQDVMKKLILK